AVLAKDRNAVERMERFPGDALRVDGPVLVALRVAARGILLRRGGDVCRREALADVLELIARLGLKTQVVDALARRAVGNGEVDARIVEHPLRVVVFLYRRRRAEEGGVEADALLEVMHCDVHVKPFHCGLLWWQVRMSVRDRSSSR